MLNIRFSAIRNAILSISMLSVFAGSCDTAASQDYLGVLPELLKPEVADRLDLSDEQRDQLRQVVRRRSMAAVGLAAQLDEAPLDRQADMRAAFGAESEQMGFELLKKEQLEKVQKFRVEAMGMLALSDEEVARKLNLADWQLDVVSDWRQQVQRNRRGQVAERTRQDAEREIRNSISDSQYEMWRFLAGKITQPPSAAPAPPQPEVAADDDDAVIDQRAIAARSQPGSAEENVFLPVEEIQLEINFQDAPWSEVIKWLAAQADLSLQANSIPPGTFTYRDRARTYPVSAAMDIMNASMLSTGHQLVRSGRILRCIDFESIPDEEIRGAFIREIADVVTSEDLAGRGDYEPVTHIFSLVRLDPTEVKEDVDQLLSIQGTATAISSTGDLIVTDMARNVRAIGDMIRRAEDPATSRGSAVQTIPLKHVNADEILMAARPLLGLEEEANTSDEISISTTLFGTTIFAKGDADKVQILRDLVKQMDVVPEDSDSIGQVETPEIRRHKVIGTDLELAYQIASQMLAGSPEVRLAKDESAKQLVLQARPSEHEMIAKTLLDLQGETSDFQVIQLENLDPQLAIAAIKKFFNLADESDGTDGNPVIDGDLLARQVWVKGSASQVSQIRAFLDNLEQNTRSTNPFGDRLMQIPLTGRSAEQTLEQARQMWEVVGGKNRIRILNPSVGTGTGLPQKSLAPNSLEKEASINRRAPSANASDSDSAMWPSRSRGKLVATQQPAAAANSSNEDQQSTTPGSADDIVVMQGPNGLIVSSDDTEALARFQEVMNMLASQAAMGAGEPTVVYLKNIKADAAKELLETIMSGSSGSSDSGGLLGDMASGVLGGLGGGMFGAMLGGGGSDLLTSSSGLASGDYTITADPRLNALVIKASASDMILMEQLLEVIDQVESPIRIETRGQLKMIPVVTKEAEEVMGIIKQLYGDRIQGTGGAPSAGGGGRGGGGRGGDGGDRAQEAAAFFQALRGGGGRGGRGGGQTQLTEAKISISAEPSTNMLIVIAQPQDIAEIEALVLEIDRYGAADPEEIAVTGLGGTISGQLFADSISRMLGPQAQTNVSSSSDDSSSNSSSSSSDSGSSDNRSEAQRQEARAAFFERLRQSGRFGGGGGTSGGRGGAGGGRPGGFGGFGGGVRGGGGGGRGGRGGGN